MKSKDWIYSQLLISAKQCDFNEDTAAVFNEFTLDFGFNVEQLNHPFKKGLGFQGEFQEEKHGKILDEYLARAHENNIKIIVYFCVHDLFPSDKEAHPSWIEKYKDGSDVRIYESHYAGCINSDWREYSVRRIKQLARHDVDGIFLDGPLFFPNACYCPACREKFRKLYGKELADATYLEFMKFRIDALTDFVRELREAVDSVDPGIVLYLNNSALRADATGSNTRELWKYVDIIGAEGGFQVIHQTESLYKVSAMAKDVACKAEGKPTVIFFSADNKPNSYYLHTPAESARIIAQSVSNGANIWYGLHGYLKNIKDEGAQRVKRFLAYLKQHKEYYERTGSPAKIALMWSQATANYYCSKVDAADFTGSGATINESELRGDHYKEFMGCYEMLAAEHVQFDVIDDVSLANGLTDKGYGLVITPCCACMSDAEIQSLEEYVSAGGNLISTLETGTYDECGRARSEWELGKIFGVKKRDIVKTWEGRCYEKIDTEKFAGIPDPMPSATLFMQVEPADGEIDILRYKPLEGRYETIEPETLKDPSVVSNGFKRGHAVLFTGDEGNYYFEWKDARRRRIFTGYVTRFAETLTETDAPACVEMTLRSQGERRILHLINLAVDGYRPMDRILPVRDFYVTVRGAAGKTAHTVDGELLQAKTAGGDLKIAVPELGDYLAIVIE